MEKQYFISLYLDTRRAKDNGKYPVRLRLFTSAPRIQKFYSTVFDFSESEFKSIWETAKPRNEYKEVRRQMQAVVEKAEHTAENIVPFSFEAFEKKLYRKTGDGQNIFWHYNQVIEELKKNNQLGSASTYDLSLKSLKGFIEHTKGKAPETLLFSEVTATWLNGYEDYMLKHKKLSLTTVGFYLRALRTLFNRAIKAGDIDKAAYPFGSSAYRMPAVKRVKKSLNRVQLKQLFEAKPQTPAQQKAKDFWFFSYSCNGMNIKDIALLRYEDLHDNTFKFIRAKTARTSKENLTEVVVYLTDYAKSIIEKYGNPNQHPKQFVFSILGDSDTETAKRAKIQNFTRFINQNLKKLAIAQGITEDISTYWARHSFATNAIRQGASMEFVSEALSHSNMKTTKGYFAGFEDEAKKELMETLMNF
jgi:site-specific recombinase XerD